MSISTNYILNLKVVIGSPSDVLPDRKIIYRAIEKVNRTLKGIGSPYRMEIIDQSQVPPASGLAQEVSSRYLQIENCDIFIALFWSRFGTPPGTTRPSDGKPYQSGTQEEIEIAFEANRQQGGHKPRIMIYRKIDPLPANLTDEDHKQYGRLLEFLGEFEPGGRHPAYIYPITVDQMEETMVEHLIAVCHELGTETVRSGTLRSVNDNVDIDETSDLVKIRQRWALLVGVNQYNDPGYPRLTYCVNDALSLQQSLKAAGYETIALHDQANQARLQPTWENIDAELDTLLSATRPEDLVWVHFACHGELEHNAPILILQNTRQNNVAKSGLFVGDILKKMRQSACRRLVLTLDACHIGIEGRRGRPDPIFLKNVYELAEGVAVIAGSTSQQFAQEDSSLGHGLFTYFLIKGVQSEADVTQKKFVTVMDLAKYTLDQIRRWRVQYGGVIQEPNIHLEGLGDMILADYREHGPPEHP